jgi:TrmH RNA methyltransferase
MSDDEKKTGRPGGGPRRFGDPRGDRRPRDGRPARGGDRGGGEKRGGWEKRSGPPGGRGGDDRREGGAKRFSRDRRPGGGEPRRDGDRDQRGDRDRNRTGDRDRGRSGERDRDRGDRPPDIWRNRPRKSPGGRYGGPERRKDHDRDRPRDRAPSHAATEPAERPRERGRERAVAGLASVAALFAVRGASVVRLFYDEATKGAAGAFCAELAKARKPYRMVDGDELARIAGTSMHGGIVAVAEARPVPGLMIAEAAAWAERGEPLVVLDGVSNPHNLGAIARTAAFFGLRRIVLSGHPDQALPSDAADRVAKGGMEHVDLYRAPDVAQTLAEIAPFYRVLATGVGGALGPAALAAEGPPVALVLGNEEEGLPAATLAAASGVITIAGAGRVQSLNVAASAAILLRALAGGRRA